ncbi:MAG: S1 RNA-binding domain-containing protein [Clostridia bacterium]|nr:S1 RNA-binding domain-containing protein [Clostridia bacterium]
MSLYLPEGFIIKSEENVKALSDMEHFKEAYQKGKALEARATSCDKNHNLHIDFGFIKGIIPRSECAIGIDEGTTRDIAIIAKVNKPVKFIITDIKEIDGNLTAILSRKVLQNRFLQLKLPDFAIGDIISASVTHLESFGVFCDIGCGINALLPIDNISVSRIPHPNVRFAVGDEIKVIVKNIDEDNRVTLSHKELLGSWEENAENFSIGETVSGIIRSVENYGIFIELAPNLAGLAEYTSNVEAGQHASVYIKSIIPEKMKFKLIIVESFNADYPIEKPRYYYDKTHIDYFRYSPECSERIIETFFNN